MNRLYEGMFLLDANETAKRWSELESHIGTLLNRNEGEIQYAERWPTQKLAYDVKGVRKGTYYLTYFTAPPEKIADLRRDAELSEHIMRLLVIQEDWLHEEMTRRRDVSALREAKAEAAKASEESTPKAAEPEAAAPVEAAQSAAAPVEAVESAAPPVAAAEASAEGDVRSEDSTLEPETAVGPDDSVIDEPSGNQVDSAEASPEEPAGS